MWIVVNLRSCFRITTEIWNLWASHFWGGDDNNVNIQNSSELSLLNQRGLGPNQKITQIIFQLISRESNQAVLMMSNSNWAVSQIVRIVFFFEKIFIHYKQWPWNLIQVVYQKTKVNKVLLYRGNGWNWNSSSSKL